MTRLSVERLEEIRARVVRWASVPFAVSGTLADYVKKANEAHTWPGAERDEEHVAEAESWAEMIGDDPVVGVLVDALRLANRDRADLLAELDAVRADLAHCERSYVAVPAPRPSPGSSPRGGLGGRLARSRRSRGQCALLAAEHLAHEATRHDRDVVVEVGRDLRKRAQAAEAQSEELAVALEHLRDVTVDLAEAARNACSAAQHPPLTDALFEVGLALARPTSEAATTARRGWEDAAVTGAFTVAADIVNAAMQSEAVSRDRAAAAGRDVVSSHRQAAVEALEAVRDRLREMAQKRQGGGT